MDLSLLNNSYGWKIQTKKIKGFKMKLDITKIILIPFLIFTIFSCTKREDNLVYKTKKIDRDISVNADWNKDVWKNINQISLNNYMGKNLNIFRMFL